MILKFYIEKPKKPNPNQNPPTKKKRKNKCKKLYYITDQH